MPAKTEFSSYLNLIFLYFSPTSPKCGGVFLKKLNLVDLLDLKIWKEFGSRVPLWIEVASILFFRDILPYWWFALDFVLNILLNFDAATKLNFTKNDYCLFSMSHVNNFMHGRLYR